MKAGRGRECGGHWRPMEARSATGRAAQGLGDYSTAGRAGHGCLSWPSLFFWAPGLSEVDGLARQPRAHLRSGCLILPTTVRETQN